MFKRRFKTAIDGKHKFGSNEYVRGRINGIMYAMCGGKVNQSFGWLHNRELDIWVLTVECTKKQYDAFVDCIEEQYPGLCVFDYAG